MQKPIFYQNKKYTVTYCGISGDGDIQFTIQDDFMPIDVDHPAYEPVKKVYFERQLVSDIFTEKLEE